MSITIHGETIDTEELIPSAGNAEMQRRFIDLVEKLEAVFGTVESDHTAAINTAFATRDENLTNHYAKLGEREGNFSADTHDTTINWPGTIDDDDIFFVFGDINGATYGVYRGEEINDLTDGTAGTALTASTGVPLYQRGSTTMRARIGKTSGGAVLLDPAAADTDASIYMYVQRVPS